MRIAIVGSSGSGKTTLARTVAHRTGIPHVEIDAFYHLAGWAPNPTFRDDLAVALEQPSWVCDGNYSIVEDLVRETADTIVVFELPRRIVMRQVTVRTVRRAITREELWNGNREPFSNFFRWDPEHNIIRWAWTRYDRVRDKHHTNATSGVWDHADVIWIRSHADADAWLTTLPVRTEGD